MNNSTPDTALSSSLSLYAILEAFLSGTNDSFMVIDNEAKVLMFNHKAEEFIQLHSQKRIQQFDSLSALLDDDHFAQLHHNIHLAFYGEVLKFSMQIPVQGLNKWYDVEVNPLKKEEVILGVAIGIFDVTEKIEAQQKLEQRESLFKALVQNSTDVFVLADKDFRFLNIAGSLAPVLGYEANALLQRRGFDIIHPDDKAAAEKWFNCILNNAGKLCPGELRMKNASGQWVWIEVFGRNLMNDVNVAAIAVNMRNIQAKKIADVALIQSEERLTLLLNNTKESFIILNSRLRIVAYNKAAQEHSPYFFRQELQSGLSFLDLVRPEEASQFIEMFEDVFNGTDREKETYFIDEDGQPHIYHHIYRSLKVNEEIQGIFITSSDTTARKLAEMKVKESEERFKTLIQYSFDAILIVDEKAVIQYISPSIKSILGYEPEEVVGLKGFDLVHAEDLPALIAAFERTVNQHSAIETQDYRMRRKDGSYVWVESKGRHMFDNKYVKGILVNLRDVTERQRMMEEQIALTEELLKHNKDLQQFSFITSHNLRAPVANLMSLLSLYNRENTSDPFNQVVMEKIGDSTNQLNDTLNDLINVLVVKSNIHTEAEYIRFDDVIAQVVKNIDNLLEDKKGEITSDFSKVPVLKYNRVHLESIVLNLVTNAIKYSDEKRRPKINIRSYQQDDFVVVEFRDNGVGIDLERYGDRMFGLYQRFHPTRDGKGLGLYMIKSQITALGGRIEVESEPGTGSCFKVYLKQESNGKI